MREWVGTTVERLLALPHRRTLEVGCGTGLLLFRVAPHAGRYRGTDFSAVALGHVRRQVEKPGSGLAHVELDRRRAYTETVLDNIGSGVVSVDAAGRITTFNLSAERILGLPKDP